MCTVPSPTLFWCFITTSFNVTSNSLTTRFSRTKAMSGSFSWYIVHCVTENKCSNSIHWADEWKNEWAQWPTRISPEILSHPPYVLSSSQTAIMGDSLPESLTLSPSPEWLGNPPPHLALFFCLSHLKPAIRTPLGPLGSIPVLPGVRAQTPMTSLTHCLINYGYYLEFRTQHRPAVIDQPFQDLGRMVSLSTN